MPGNDLKAALNFHELAGARDLALRADANGLTPLEGLGGEAHALPRLRGGDADAPSYFKGPFEKWVFLETLITDESEWPGAG